MAKSAAVKAVKSASIVLSFTFERETKNTYRFAEDGDDAMVGTLYVKKSAFSKGAPESLTATVTA